MSINSIGGNTTPTDPRNGTQGVGGKSGSSVGQQPAKGGSGETVNISASAIDLQSLEARLGELPEVDRARVTDLRNQIANGEYKIDSQSLADRILAFESDL